MKNFCLLFLFISFNLLSSSLQAQERYRIIYDYNTDLTAVYHLNAKNEIDDTLKRPALKRNSMVEVRLKNVNPFAVQIQPKITGDNFEPTQLGFNPSSLLSGINAFQGGDVKLNIAKLPTDNVFTRGIDSTTTDSQGEAKSRGAMGDDFSEGYKDLRNIYAGIDEIKARLVGSLVNPNLSKKQIFEKAVHPSNLIQDDRLANHSEDFLEYLTKLESIIIKDSQEMAGLLNAISELDSEEFEDTGLSRGQKRTINLRQNQISQIITDLEDSGNAKLDDLKEIKSLYLALDASSFEKTVDFLVENDRTDIALNFKQSSFADDLENGEGGQEALKTRKIKVFAKGGVKVNTSVAITLNNYKGNSNDFFTSPTADDSSTRVVGADENDFFTPNLSTMVNFYPVLSENFNLGGTFGLSIPITTGDETPNGINFLIGPTFFFGSESRVSFSGGLAYGPVQRLKDGLKVGDPTTLDAKDLTKTVYDTGFFFGVSFSLFELNNN